MAGALERLATCSYVLINGCLSHFPRKNCTMNMCAPGGRAGCLLQVSLVPVHQARDAWGSSGISTQVLRPTLSRAQWGTAQEAWGERMNTPIGNLAPQLKRVCSIQLGWTWPHGQGQRETQGSFLSHSLTVTAAIRGGQPGTKMEKERRQQVQPPLCPGRRWAGDHAGVELECSLVHFS